MYNRKVLILFEEMSQEMVIKGGIVIIICSKWQWHTQEFCRGGGVQQIQLRTESGVLEAAVIWYKKFHFI